MKKTSRQLRGTRISYLKILKQGIKNNSNAQIQNTVYFGRWDIRDGVKGSEYKDELDSGDKEDEEEVLLDERMSLTH